jgi:hypothetical protein
MGIVTGLFEIFEQRSLVGNHFPAEKILERHDGGKTGEGHNGHHKKNGEQC